MYGPVNIPNIFDQPFHLELANDKVIIVTENQRIESPKFHSTAQALGAKRALEELIDLLHHHAKSPGFCDLFIKLAGLVKKEKQDEGRS